MVFVTGGSGDGEVAIDAPTSAASDQPTAQQPVAPVESAEPSVIQESAPEDPATPVAPSDPSDEPLAEEQAVEPAITPAPEASTFEPPTGPIPFETRDEAGEDQPIVFGSDGLPIFNYPPLDFDDSLADSPWAPTPCPVEEPLVACIFAAISADEDTGEITVPWFSLGFTPELEPVGHHLHFYIPELVDGDESKAGTASPGGAWRQWDDPSQAGSFNGDNGRTLYTLTDFRQAGSNTLCVLVATPDNKVIPGSGNCAPVAATDDFALFSLMVDRIEGQWVGTCGSQAMVIAPPDWRWYDLTEQTVAEVAAIIRPTNTAAATEILQARVDNGAVVWAEGPVIDDYIVNMSLSVVPGDFGLNDSPADVGETIQRLGLETSSFQTRQVQGRTLLVGLDDLGNGIAAVTYLVPDSGYLIAMRVTAPAGAGLSNLADQMAYSIHGC